MYRVPVSQTPAAIAASQRSFSHSLALALFAGLLGLAFVWPEKSEWAMRSHCENDQGVVTPQSPTAPAGISWREQSYGWPLTFKVYELDLCYNSQRRTWNLASLGLDALCYTMLAVAAAWIVNRIQRGR